MNNWKIKKMEVELEGTLSSLSERLEKILTQVLDSLFYAPLESLRGQDYIKVEESLEASNLDAFQRSFNGCLQTFLSRLFTHRLRYKHYAHLEVCMNTANDGNEVFDEPFPLRFSIQIYFCTPFVVRYPPSYPGFGADGALRTFERE